MTLLSAFGGAAVGSTGGGVRGTWCLLVGGLAQLGRDQHNRVVGKKGPQGW